MTGYVYAIRNEHDQVKIGHSINPLARLKALSIGVPFEVALVGYVDGTSADEYALHRKFDQWRIRGEWYRNEGDVSSFVASLPQMNIAGVPPRAMAWAGSRFKGRGSNRARRRRDNAISSVIGVLGGQARVAQLCGVSQQAVSNWAVRGKFPAYTRIILGNALESVGCEINESLWVSERGAQFIEATVAA